MLNKRIELSLYEKLFYFLSSYSAPKAILKPSLTKRITYKTLKSLPFLNRIIKIEDYFNGSNMIQIERI